MKAGHDSVKLMVSTENHLYDIDDVKGGEFTWQSVGAWDSGVVRKLTDAIRERNAATEASKAKGVNRSNFVESHGPGLQQKARPGRCIAQDTLSCSR